MTETVEDSYLLEVRGDRALQIQEDLNAAVDRVVLQATRIGRHGVLVTQHSPTFYTVTLSPDVPYGQIQERRVPDSTRAGAEQPSSWAPSSSPDEACGRLNVVG